MAGYFGAGLAGALQGYNEAQANQLPKMMQVANLQGELQKQAMVRAQLQAQSEAQQALPILLGGVNQYFGTPSPGQPSVPMQPSQSSLPGIAAGQINNPANAAQGVGPMGIMPYRSMHDITSQAQQPQQPMDMQSTYAKIASMNISPMAKQMLLKEMQPIIAQQETSSLRRDTLDATKAYREAELASRNKTKDRWSDPYQMGGAFVQKNLDTGEIRQAVSRTPVGAEGKLPSLGNWNAFTANQEKILKPIDEAQTQSQEIRGLLSSDNPAAAPQVQKLLTLYLQRTRFTNLNYGDQRSFGDVYQRFGNAISRWYAGDFTDTNKKMILDMLDVMDKKVMEPARKNMQDMFYKRLKASGVPDEQAKVWANRPATFSSDPLITSDPQSILNAADAILSGKK